MQNNLSLILNNQNITEEELNKQLNDIHPYDIASSILILSKEERKKLFEVLDDEKLSNILEYVSEEEAVDLINEVASITNLDKLASVIGSMESDDATDVLKQLDQDLFKEIERRLDKDIVEDIKELSKYQENEAGSIMTNNFIVININDTIPEVMKKIVTEANDQEAIDKLFVIDDHNIFIGILDLKTLIIARKEEKIKDIIETNYKYCEVTDNINDVSFLMKEYNLLFLPVLKDKILEGIITIDDVFDIIDEEKNDDYDKLAGLSGENDTSIKTVISSRIPWLIVLLILSFLVSLVLGVFEEIIASVTVLIFFQTLILDMGGNSGTQSLASSVINLSKSKFTKKKSLGKHLKKELLSGLINGLILGVSAFIVSLIFMLIKKDTSNEVLTALIVGVSMCIGVDVSNFIGALIPIVLDKIHIDPAVASGPFITTINDILGVVVYYSLAYLILLQGGLL